MGAEGSNVHPATSPGRLSAAAAFLRREAVGGLVLLAATALALVWANSPWQEGYEALSEFTIGPESLHLDLTLATWAKDGLLAVFFFIAGLELKRELVLGELRDPRRAMLPVIAAACGMVVPALVFILVARGAAGWEKGWAIPTATDIAFALGIMAITASRLPRNLRTYLLTLAVVDDLGAIILIAVLFTSDLSLGWLAVSAALMAVYFVLQRRRVTTPIVYVPLAFAVWATMHSSGVHATFAGVALGVLTRATHDPDEDHSPAERLEHRLQPFSAGFCVPVFALFAAGVPLSYTALKGVSVDPIAQGVMAGLVVGKPLGILGGSWLAVRTGLARLPNGVGWRDLTGVGLVAGVGFTVSLLIAELAYEGDALQVDRAKTAVLLGSTVMALIASAVLHRRSRHHERLPAIGRIDSTLEIDVVDLDPGPRDPGPHTHGSRGPSA